MKILIDMKSESAVLKLKWKAGDKPTGLSKVVDRRRWPSATYPNGDLCAQIDCETGDSFNLGRAKSGEHGLLKLNIIDYARPKGNCKWSWSTLKKNDSRH